VALPEMVEDEAGDGAGRWGTAGREPGEPTCERLLVRVRQEREFLTAVLRHIPAGVAIVDAASRRLLFRNAQADAILGPPGPRADDVLAAYRDLCPMHADGRPRAPQRRLGVWSEVTCVRTMACGAANPQAQPCARSAAVNVTMSPAKVMMRRIAGAVALLCQ
jgi:hypothetical protein